jgi:hypothetical protein
MSDPDYDSEVFRLAVTAAFYHPKIQVRKKFRRLFGDWIGQSSDMPAEDEVRRLITSEKGTRLEPFSITAEDIECAAFLARVAFSGLDRQTRFRIVSRETLGCSGGLVLTNNLKSYYSERYAHGRRRNQTYAGWAFIPSLIPAGTMGSSVRLGAALYSEDQGFRIVIPLPECASSPAVFARQLQQWSRIQGVSESFNQLGLRVECYDGKAHILSGSPESMIRIMAHMVAETTLILKGDASSTEIPTIYVSLRMPEDKPVTLPSVIGHTPGYTAWMSTTARIPIPLEDEDKLAIFNWLGSHPHWINLVFDHLK